ncbi:MAG: hypothetical protein HY319_23580 [Armatimonadetes bacterium]|nr:hypothetical protein [Armatimonadota bacterium]
MQRTLVLLLILNLLAAGCEGNSSRVPTAGGDGGRGNFADEPIVTIRTFSAPDRADIKAQQIVGHAMDVEGIHPAGHPYKHTDFFMKGGGLQGIDQPPNGLQQFSYPYMAFLAGDTGANCIRTYGAAFPPFGSGETPQQQQMDTSAALTWATNATSGSMHMFVAVGITLQNSGAIDYTNTAAGSPLMVQRQNALQFVQLVGQLDNNRQIAWIVGNELVQSSDPTVKAAVYTEINTIAQMIKSQGSSLPCMTAVPTVTTDELELIAQYCPDLDMLGVNDYYGAFGTRMGGGFLNTLHQTMVASRGQAKGWKKPYVVSEFGSYDLAAADLPLVTLPNTPAFTPQGYYGLEANSTAVAQNYLTNYQTYIEPFLDGDGCLGSFCYVWENPVFSTYFAYYFEMFITGPDSDPSYNPPGEFRTQSVGAMVQAWGGTDQGGPYPQISSADGDPQAIQCTFKATASDLTPTPVSPGQQLQASITASYASSLTFNWYIVDDTAQHYNPQLYEGTTSNAPVGLQQSTATSGPAQTNSITFTAPTTPGNYQLRVTITDGTDPATQAPAATAAIFFHVQ